MAAGGKGLIWLAFGARRGRWLTTDSPPPTESERSRNEAPLWWVRAFDTPLLHGVPDNRIGHPDGRRLGAPGAYVAVCGAAVYPAAATVSPWVRRCAACQQWARRWAGLPWPQLPYRERDDEDD
ncbi:hypothetical protein GCM10012275_04830 [Longimycelium tulufanense]|uniref:Uncharacterized protein n=1 Tax=Longimycelium tulufanense TaxID=907463 RepID=A0A8J3CAC8_9PSEU|nr:hypothetical protein [Longimycelium tulufanense]GGM36645.1 hypothetical protein GCM10012275_04830 [Longimycelium tulufanense]